MKTLEHLEKYVISPNISFYGGFIYDGEDIFLCDDKERGKGYYIRVTCFIKNNVLETKIYKRYQKKDGKWVTDRINQKVEIDKGQRLVYVQGVGFTISEYKLSTIDEAIEQYKVIKGDFIDDTRRSKKDNA